MTKPKNQKSKLKASGKTASEFTANASSSRDETFQAGLKALDARIALVGREEFERETEAQLRVLQDKGYRL